MVVLGGGGAKALAHIGAWRALEEAGIRPAGIVGTSMGAVLGAALATGVTSQEVRKRLGNVDGAQIAVPNPLAFVAGLFADGLLLATILLHRADHTQAIPCVIDSTKRTWLFQDGMWLTDDQWLGMLPPSESSKRRG